MNNNVRSYGSKITSYNNFTKKFIFLSAFIADKYTLTAEKAKKKLKKNIYMYNRVT